MTKRHSFSEKFEATVAPEELAYITLKHLTFVIDSTPKVVPFALDLHKGFI